MDKRSLWAHSRREIERHKWIESEKAGRDLGDAPVFDWISMHWNGYLRARWLEHLQGKTFWIELDRGTFGALANRFQDNRSLFDHIVDRFKAGQENLHIIWWAIDSSHAMDDVHAILEALDVNGVRLGYRFDG